MNILLTITEYYSKMLLVMLHLFYTDGKLKLQTGSTSCNIIGVFY